MNKIELVKCFEDGTEISLGVFDTREEAEKIVQDEINNIAETIEEYPDPSIICFFEYRDVTIH